MSLRDSSQIRQVLRSLYSGIGKSSVIFPSTFLVTTGISIIELGIIFYIREIFAATPSEIGYFIALWSFFYIIGCVFIRPLFNRVLPRYLIICSSLFMCLFIFLLLFTKRFLFALVYYDLYAVAMSFFWPPIMGWLSQDVEGPRLGKSMSYFNLSWNAGAIIGPLIAGVLSAISPEVPLYAGILLFLLTGMLVTAASFFLPKVRADRSLDTAPSRETSKSDQSTLLRFPGWVGMFTTFVVIGVFLSIFPVYAKDELFIRKEVIGILIQSLTFVATFIFIILGHTTFWHFRISQMVLGQVCLACIIFFMTFATSPFVLAVLITLIGALRALCYNNSIFHGVSGSINRTRRMAINEVLLAAGLICGSILGGLFYQHYSMATVFYFSAAVVIFGAAIQAGLYFILKIKEERITSSSHMDSR